MEVFLAVPDDNNLFGNTSRLCLRHGIATKTNNLYNDNKSAQTLALALN
jgi:hypothetical protein